MYDLIIIGAGPAGLTAGIYAGRANIKTLILEKESIGGQISSSPLVENYPGYLSISGSDLSNNLFDQVMNLNVEFEIEEVKEIKNDSIKQVITEDNIYNTKAIIIATGSKYRLLGLENEQNLIGKGIHFCTTCDGPFYKNKVVAVIGGGNTAVTNAIYLSELCEKVYLICRKDQLTCEEKLIKEVNKIDNINIIYNSTVTEIIGKQELSSIKITNSNTSKIIKLDGMFESIGMVPQTACAKVLQKDKHKYILSNDCLTDIPGIFVAGDCREKNVRQLTTAVSDGSITAIEAIKYIKH